VSLQSQRIKKQYAQKSDLQIDSRIMHFQRRLFTRLALFIKSKRGKDIVSLAVLADYIMYLVMVAAAAVLFWGLTTKLVANRVPLPLCLQFSISHFLPGIQPRIIDSAVPMWTSIGPAATAWILFVLYVGPAGSLLPEKQRAAIKVLSQDYSHYRRAVLTLGREDRKYELLVKKLK
jgi:hypothetical protein